MQTVRVFWAARPQRYQDFPEMDLERLRSQRNQPVANVVCEAPVAHADKGPVVQDIGRLKAALSKTPAHDAFMSSVSPGCLMTYVPNQFYDDRDQYREALVEALGLNIRRSMKQDSPSNSIAQT